MEIYLEIQASTPKRSYHRLRRHVDFEVLPDVGDRVRVEFWSDGLNVISREFTLGGEIVLNLGFHGFDEEDYSTLSSQGWNPIDPRR